MLHIVKDEPNHADFWDRPHVFVPSWSEKPSAFFSCSLALHRNMSQPLSLQWRSAVLFPSVTSAHTHNPSAHWNTPVLPQTHRLMVGMQRGLDDEQDCFALHLWHTPQYAHSVGWYLTYERSPQQRWLDTEPNEDEFIRHEQSLFLNQSSRHFLFHSHDLFNDLHKLWQSKNMRITFGDEFVLQVNLYCFMEAN